MKRIKARVSIPYLLATFGACIFLLGSSIKSNVAPRQFNPTVKIAVSKLEIIETKMLSPNVIQVFMRNGYSKDITAVVASIGDHKVTRRDYIYAETEQHQKLPPGATDDFLYGVDSIDEENIVIKAVLFSDMTTEGDFREIKKVLDKRLGFKIQLARFNAYLENLNKVNDTLVETELQKVRQFAENLPVKPVGDFPISYSLEFGLKNGKLFILRYLSEMNKLLEDDEKLATLNNKRPVGVRYENFRDKSLRVEANFKSLESRL